MSAAAPKVFISYRREETAGHAGRLKDSMVQRFGDQNVFMDIDMEPGIDFPTRIKDVIGACRALLVVMGPTWAIVPDNEGHPRLSDPEDFVRMEVESALRRDEVTVIPVLVAGAQMPEPEDLPEGLRGLAYRNALELSDRRWGYDVGRLIRALETKVAPPTGVEPVPAATAPPAPPSLPGVRLLVEGMAVAGLAGLIVTSILASPEGTVKAGILRQAAIWALIGVVLGIWIAFRSGDPGRIAVGAVVGLLLGAIGGALGGAIVNVTKDLSDLSPKVAADRDTLDQIWIASRAVHGAFIGALLGALWMPRRIATGLAAGLVIGALVQLLFIGVWADWRDAYQLATVIEAVAIAGAVIASLLAVRSRRSPAPSPNLDSAS